MFPVRFLAVLFAGAILLSGSRNDGWSVIGPGGGGAQFCPAISPHDPDFVVVSSDMTGTYLTKDGGKNWRMINLRGVPAYFVFDPSDSKTLYARTLGLWRSADSGVTWELVYPDPKYVTGSRMTDDHASEIFTTTSGDADTVDAMAVDPKDSRSLYAVFSGRGHSVLRGSTDRGRTWVTLALDVPKGSTRIYVDPASPFRTRTLYVAGSSGVAVLRQGALHLGAGPGEAFIDVAGGFAAEGGKPVIYGAGHGGVYVSRDGGDSWNRSAPGQKLLAIATSAAHPNVAYVSIEDQVEGASHYFGVSKTTDFGATWKPVWKEASVKSPKVDSGWVSQRFGPGWGGPPLALAVSPVNPELCYATDLGRTLRTTEGGANWMATYTRRAAGGWTTTGLDVTTNYGVHFDPFDRNHVFISYTDIGLFESGDGGGSWHSATEHGVPRPWVNTTYWMVFDPEVRGRMWAVMSGTHDLPRPKMWRRASPASYQGGVVQSDDGGKTWRALNRGLPQTAATHILLDTRGKSGTRVLYVAGFGRGVFRSGDGGATWELRNSGLPSPEPFVWRLAQDRDGVLYAVIARRSDDGSIGDAGDGALYRSRNEGAAWEKVPLPAGVNGPNGLAIDPVDPKRLYLAAWRRDVREAEAGGGIYLSSDGGDSWRQVLSKDQHVYDVTIDPTNRTVLYASGFESSAWRSTDRGDKWQRIRGYNFKWGHRVIPDPRDGSKIFITTFGGSVWHGPATGDPKAVEDVVTPVAAFSH